MFPYMPNGRRALFKPIFGDCGMQQLRIRCVGNAEFPRLYCGDSFETEITTDCLTQRKTVQAVIRIAENGSLHYGVEYLIGTENPTAEFFFGVETNANLLDLCKCLILIEGCSSISNQTFHDALETVAEGFAEVGKWREGNVVQMLKAPPPPNLTQVLFLLYDMGIDFDRKPFEALLESGALRMSDDDLRILEIEDPAQKRTKRIQQCDALAPFKKAIEEFQRDHNNRVKHEGCNCGDMYRVYLLEGLRRGISDSTILAAAAYFQFMEKMIAFSSVILVPLHHQRMLELVEKYKLRMEALQAAIDFGLKIAGGETSHTAESLRAAVLNWNRGWKTAPKVKSI
jgi:hypothetical protein